MTAGYKLVYNKNMSKTNTAAKTWNQLTAYIHRSRTATDAVERQVWLDAAAAVNARRKRLGIDIFAGRPR